jgi:hypothetical protein
MSIQVLEKSKECRHGCASGGTMLMHMVDITVMGRSVRTGGEGIGHLRGYKKNGEDLISWECVGVADHLVLVDLSDLEARAAAFLDAAT